METFQIQPIPVSYLDRIRAAGQDDFGNPVVSQVVEAAGGTPLRCCLREANVAELVALISYQPSTIGGPYVEVGPVFVHADPCPGWSALGYPEGFRHRPQLLRAYDDGGNQLDNILVEPGAQEAGIEKLLGRPDVAFIHSRNLLPGCFMFTIERRP